MVPPTVLVSKPVKSATPWSSCTTGAPARRSVNEASAPVRGPSGWAPRRRRSRRCSGTTASFSVRRQEALAQPGVGEQHRRLGGGGLAVEEGGLHAGEVELGALRLAAAGPGDDRAIAGAHQLLQLRLGLAQRARGGVGALGAELVRLVAGDARQAQRRAPVERLGQAVRMDVEVVGVLVVEAGRHVLPEVAQRRRQLLLGRDRHERVLRHQVEQLAEAVDRQHVGDVGALVGLAWRRRSRPARGARAPSSAAGAISTRSASSSERWVKVENQVRRSTSTSNSSQRTARSSVAG